MRLPDSTALGERPVPILPRRTPNVSTYPATTGFEEVGPRALAESGAQLDQASHVAAQAKELQDHLRAEDKSTELRQAQIDMTFGKDGFVNFKGGDAVNRPILKEYGDKFDQAAARIGGTLDNDYQKQILGHRAQVMGLQLREDIAKHIVHEGIVYDDTVFKSRLDVETKAAASRWSAPDGAVLPLLNIDDAIHRQAERRGLPQEWIDDTKQKSRSLVYSEQIKQALVSDPANGPFVAQAMFKKYYEQIDPLQRAVIGHEINIAVRPIEAKRDAEATLKGDVLPGVQAAVEIGGERVIQATVTQDVTGRPAVAPAAQPKQPQTKMMTQANLGDWVVAAEARAEATHPGDTLYRDMVVQNVRGYVSTIVVAQDGIQKKNYGTLLTALQPLQGPKPVTVDELLANPANRVAYFSLDPLQQSGILGHLHQNMREAEMGHPMRSDTRIVEDLMRRIHLPDGDPNNIRTVGQLMPYFGKGLTRVDFDWLGRQIEQKQTPDGQRLTNSRNDFFAAVKAQFDKSTMMIPDPIGGERFLSFKQYVMGLEREAIKSGTDPYQLYTFGAKDYAGNKIPGFVGSFEQRLQSTLDLLRPGETAMPPVTGRPAARPAAPAIVNPTTGERLILKDGKWQKP